MNDDLKFNEILKRQKILPSSTNLSARIIAAAIIKKDTPLWTIIMQEINQMLYIPRPAYALAFSLILGIVLGLRYESSQIVEIQDWFSLMEISNDYTDEDWL
jgi:hypothetical protein